MRLCCYEVRSHERNRLATGEFLASVVKLSAALSIPESGLGVPDARRIFIRFTGLLPVSIR